MNGVPAVGDSMRDLQAARDVGALPVLVATGKGKSTARLLKSKESPVSPDDVIRFKDLASFADTLLAGDLDSAILERLN